MFFERNYFPFPDDAYPDGLLKNEALLRIFEDIGSRHSASVGDAFNVGSRAWILAEWKVEFSRRPESCEELSVKTWVRGEENAFWCFRDFLIADASGKEVARACAKMTVVDMAEEKLLRVSADLLNAYCPETERAFPTDPTRIPMPKNFDEGKILPLRKSDFDQNGHVHNTRYVTLAEEFVPDAEKKNSFSIVYRSPVKPGVSPVVKTASTDFGETAGFFVDGRLCSLSVFR